MFRKDGTLVTRFSDIADRDGIPQIERHRTEQQIPGYVENRYETQLTLPPGEYDLRVALGDGTRFGRAEIPFTVDSYHRNGLAMSQVSLCKQITDVAANSSQNRSTFKLPGAWDQKLPGDYKPLVSRDIEFKPTGNAHFKKRGTLYTYFEIYEPLLSPATVQFAMRVVDSKTGEVISDSQPISAAPYKKTGSSIIPVGRGLDISKLPKGSYRLDVQATDSTGKSTPWRTANFTVE